ncbi:hypothetical protein Ancab_033788, partial [Ancistrocladus abbreviatus]
STDENLGEEIMVVRPKPKLVVIVLDMGLAIMVVRPSPLGVLPHVSFGLRTHISLWLLSL